MFVHTIEITILVSPKNALVTHTTICMIHLTFLNKFFIVIKVCKHQQPMQQSWDLCVHFYWLFLGRPNFA